MPDPIHAPPAIVLRRPSIRTPLVAMLACAVVAVPATAVVADAPCLIERIRIDEPCSGDGCWYTFVGATEVDGIRHVVWRQNESTPRVRTAKILPDGTVELGEIIATDLPVPGTTVYGLAVQGDLLAIGLHWRVDIHRLIDGDWSLEASITPPGGPLPPTIVRLAIDSSEGVERVIASAADALGPLLSSPVIVFRRDAEWTVEQVIAPPSGTTGFGADIAIDGTTIAVGAPDSGGSFSSGGLRVVIYDLVDDVWTLTQMLEGYQWSAASTGHRLTLVGDTLVATNAAFNPLTNLAQKMHLQFWHRGDDGFVPTDFIEGTTTLRRGWELDGVVDGEDVRIVAPVYRAGPVIEGAFVYRVRDGIVYAETPLPVPDATVAGYFAPTWGVAAVGVSAPWVALTTPQDPLGASVSVIALGGPSGACPGVDGGVLGDLDGDGVVNGADVGLLLSAWGPCVGCAADLNGDGVVDGADLGLLLGVWSAMR